MRALIVGPEAKEGAARVMAHARQHVYHPGDDWIPGDDPSFVLHIPDGFRCVFTYTRGRTRGLYRHLSISVPGEKYPNPEACIMIAKLFEFSRGMGEFEIPQSWQLGMNENEHCIVLVEELE